MKTELEVEIAFCVKHMIAFKIVDNKLIVL